jgi:two-component system, OmpR family, alkaline phosphatase synthesis response regulator PhoP
MDKAKTTIVYVDDDPDDRKLVRDQIERHIANPITYLSTGEELFERLANQGLVEPGIILVDLALPGMSGFDVVRKVRHQHKYLDRTPMIVVTGTDDEVMVETARLVGADAYIPKPMTLFSFMSVLRRLGRYELEIMDRRAVPA